MNDVLVFRCPECSKRIAAPPALSGTDVACPKCSVPLRVPKPGDSPEKLSGPAAATAPVGSSPPPVSLPAPRAPHAVASQSSRRAASPPPLPRLSPRAARASNSAGVGAVTMAPPPLPNAALRQAGPRPAEPPASAELDDLDAPPLASSGQAPTVPMGAPASLDALPKKRLDANWNVGRVNLPNYLVRGRGDSLEDVVGQFVTAIQRQQHPKVETYIASEAQNIPRQSRPIRVLYQLQPRHVTATDVQFQSQGSDLYVRFACAPRTWMAWLQRGLYGALFCTLFLCLFGAYLFGTGAFHGWLVDYGAKVAQVEHGTAGWHTRKREEGYYTLNAAKVRETLDGYDLDADWRRAASLLQQEIETMGNGNSQDFGAAMETFGNVMVMQQLIGMQSDGFIHAARLMCVNTLNDTQYVWWFDPNAPVMGHMFGISMPTDDRMTTQIDFLPEAEGEVRAIFQSLAEAYSGGDADSNMAQAVVAAYENGLEYHRPWNPIDLLLADPKIYFFNAAGATTVIGLLVGGALWILPSTWLRHPCRLLGWPSPSEFNDTVRGHNAWVERVLSDTLLHEFGVQEADRFTIHDH